MRGGHYSERSVIEINSEWIGHKRSFSENNRMYELKMDSELHSFHMTQHFMLFRIVLICEYK
jgi:hypothetical protein